MDSSTEETVPDAKPVKEPKKAKLDADGHPVVEKPAKRKDSRHPVKTLIRMGCFLLLTGALMGCPSPEAHQAHEDEQGTGAQPKEEEPKDLPSQEEPSKS